MWTTRELIHLRNKVYLRKFDPKLVDEVQRIIDGLHGWVKHDGEETT